MDNNEFVKCRQYLKKTQKEMAQLLCVSMKAVQSYEQGWRNIPSGVGREMLLLLALKHSGQAPPVPCWEIKNCPSEWRKSCIVWEYGIRHFCWLVNGTFCQGKCQGNWEKKIKLCRSCEMFRAVIPPLS